MYPFKFPNTKDAIRFSNLLSVGIEELNAQSFATSQSEEKFQFLFNTKEDDSTSTITPYNLTEIGRNMTDYMLYNPISILDSITLSFGNPFNTLSLFNDRIQTVSITQHGHLSKIEFTEEHSLNDGDYIILEYGSTGEKFTTSDPTNDSFIIEQFNDRNGWPVTVTTPTQVDIEIDLTGMVGIIENEPYTFYVESRRFIIPLEISYLSF